MREEEEEEEEFNVWTKYSFVKGEVPKFHYTDPIGLKLVEEQAPVILTGSDLVATAFKWDLAYLEEHIGPGPFAVYSHSKSGKSCGDSCSCPQKNGSQNEDKEKGNASSDSDRRRSRINVFKYYDDKKLEALHDKSVFQQDIERMEIKFTEFLEKYRGDRKRERVYLQQPLTNNVGRVIAADFVGFCWSWLIQQQKQWGWGPLTSNLLLIGQKGNVTPCHYDEQQNLFCQLQGSKRFLLFSPENFSCLYPYPVHHPHDRQSQVDLDYPDTDRFPNFADAHAVEAIVNPGDILYIPMYWWHHVVNLEDTVSINFWHKAGSNSQIEYPLKARQKVAMVRNVEKMLLEALQDQEELKNVLHWIVDGRF